ncbi:Hypp83 [Branchiostoma lanceolatum]|uniref:Hypp83 protein n=1 Tax=Branchiostoma lanceolatum TaxID=7740 RepID=A0A8J9YJ44_BRALA|nr:Hypp83 [Branchiostoma lanceolatum]
MLSSVYDEKPHEMKWSLRRLSTMIRGSATLVVQVPKFFFCTRHNANDLSFGWMVVSRYTEVEGVNPGTSCGDLDSSLSTISIQAPVLILATDGSLADKLVPNTLDQCRQVWEYDGGIAVPVDLLGSVIFRLVSMATGNTTFEGVAMSFVQTQDTNTPTTTESGCSHTIDNHNDTKNITCILLTKDEHTEMFFAVPKVQCQAHATETTYRTNTNHSSRLIHLSENTKLYYTSSEPGDNSTSHVRTTPGPEVPPATDDVIISVVVSAAVAGLVAMSLVALVLKLHSKLNVEDGMASDDAHTWTLPPGVAFPGLLRSASLPSCSIRMSSDDVASCRSLPAVLHSIKPTYCEIPDDTADAQRPLPSLPHLYWEIPDDAISGVVRSASLPAVTCTRGETADDAASCRSLPAIILSIEPTYSEIPDHMAAAHRPLPALPRTHWGIPDHEAAAQHHLPAPRHTYGEIPDDEESGPMPFYADASEFSLHVVTNRRQNRWAFRDNTTTSSRHQAGRSIAMYGSTEQAKTQRNSFYRNAPEVQGMRARRQLRTALALVSQPADHGVRTYVNRSTDIPGEGTGNTSQRVSISTLPNTYWPWEILAGEGTRNTSRRASLPYVTLPNTYWPWEIPGEGTRNTPGRASLPYVTLPNTYWPWEILAGEGTRNTSRRASLPYVTLPNTYWPWEIPGEGTRNTPGRASLPYVTLPNTYWPWEIPGEGTRNTSRCASLPNVTLPNTYWPWEIPGEATRNTPLPASLSTLPNTYWPWEIPGDGTRNTPRRASLPYVTLPNTYWPWEIPGEGTRNTPGRASLPYVTLPNTYWPWEIPREGTRNTSRRASLPNVTLPNTYWPWEIPGEGTRNTPLASGAPPP